MEHLAKTLGQIHSRTWLVALSVQAGLGVLCGGLLMFDVINNWQAVCLYALSSIGGTWLVAKAAANSARMPLQALGDAIMHISPGSEAQHAAPNTEKLALGREYVTNLAYQLYQIASLQNNKDLAEHKREATQATNVVSHFPLPLFVFNKQQLVTFASDSALSYVHKESAALFGKPLFDVLNLEFPSDFTLETWINDCEKNKVTDTAYWRRVRLHLPDEDGGLKQCDMAGYYNRDNASGTEFILTFFDRSEEYADDDQALSFIALAVHELRTPLTLLRGYIEVFQEELDGKLDEELTTYMTRVQSSSQQLAAFVNNILNVARVEGNQLPVKLREQNWEDALRHAGNDMTLRAQTFGKELVYEVGPDLPTAAADQMMISEVIYNLLDNAIKYSGESKQIYIKTYVNQAGMIETIIQDKGVGIPVSVVPSLFEKFHRNHRNRDQISGTGLGLYLAKAIVNAHGGEIWVNSKEGEGTIVGFTLQPYAQLAEELKSGNNDVMIRTAHGWVKNHSVYRG